MRKALDALRINPDPRTDVADFILLASELDGGPPSWDHFGVRTSDRIKWCVDAQRYEVRVRVILRQEAPPTFVDLMAA
jgi:hypothetical protein